MGYEFVAPRAELSRVDGICRIGIHPDSGIAVIALDTSINVALAAIFIWQLRPALGSTVPMSLSRTSNASSEPTNRSLLDLLRRNRQHQKRYSARANPQRNLKMMLIRNVVGSSLLLCMTITNNAIFLTWPFATHSHACQLMCLTDSKHIGKSESMLTNQYHSCTGYACHELAYYAVHGRICDHLTAHCEHVRFGKHDYATNYA